MTHHDVIVIGGGQAGLAIGYHLAKQGRRFTILDAGDAPAAAWRSRWDSLRLFTPVRYDGLPGLPFPGEPHHYPTRDEVVDYLTGYARSFELPVELSSRVRTLRRTDDGYLVELADRVFTADQVVVATGPFQTPRIPAAGERLAATVHQLHSSDYRAPSSIPEGSVLIVGGGNTGFQIADELAATHDVHLSIGSRQAPLPQRILGRDLFTFLSAIGLMGKTADSRIGRRLSAKESLIGSRPRSIRRRGVQLRARTTDTQSTTATFADGTTLEPHTVIWATGFGRDYSFVDVPVFDSAGAPVHRRGVTGSPGLFFLGMPWQHTRGSALLGWVKDDAQHIADRIDALAAGLKPQPLHPQSPAIAGA